MEVNLLDITTEELLEKFGAGNHKPGSGSAAAFQGMLSAKLLVTVISLTNEEKRRHKYKIILPQLLVKDNDIQERIFPDLTRLFHEDAIQFGRTITAREERDNEVDLFKNNKLGRTALDELKVSIEIPLSIGKLCIELAEISELVFESGFQSARGDSQVALSGSIAGLAGCLSIIQLNLLSFGSDEYFWTSKIIVEAKKLKSRYQELNESATAKIESLEKEVDSKAKLYNKVDKLLKRVKSKSKLNNTDIQEVVSELQNLMWIHKNTIWPSNTPGDPTKVLMPSTVFRKALGFKYSLTSDIGVLERDNEYTEIAGLIDQKDKIVLISSGYDDNIQNFTAAHELGHAVLHTQTIMHRDRPINGTTITGKRSLQEIQADKFATYFLMPSKLVQQIFRELFLTNKFVINDNTAFLLTNDSSADKLKNRCKNLRGLALKLASTERYNDQSFLSIAKLFNVSTTAMAIRLEELELIEF
ncbi:ImmA/IrrE family metallo-endopeptidase [Subsaximicrobium wynnwilliamsii]|uniref:ImmA/IrrE family metallo-endopeptidase n=1 Tax=Subsaximicrobium wynnwilliamsii TaxID=291179 RepID=A0A5C6ZDA2_9FLAO|nr:cyclodeaminase/cyclohydrolase family protein [Subsaximicrobium wynnwilliamsii]TXD81492.1 ImmA/IrrE family metallo-endopeptidase [Subsaximicrobium wynnwilliamsii]TXD87159.1 ImmA/IrrE family metallo-endopeptidase [Subsaximicrobium wynnwilliamsii]TXE00852.1 ImmA/IrrE family metallo-endopeptidase [Subsaximicrobium wynnwilliamsii]